MPNGDEWGERLARRVRTDRTRQTHKGGRDLPARRSRGGNSPSGIRRRSGRGASRRSPSAGSCLTLLRPATSGTSHALLAELRKWAGSPRQSEIEKRSWGTLPDATISAMLQKDRWRTTSDRERSRARSISRGPAGLPAAEVTRWVEAYERLRHVPPTDDLARARAEGAELRRRLTDAQAEAAELRERLAASESRRRAEDHTGPATDTPPRRRPNLRRRRSLSVAVAAVVFAAGAGRAG